MYREIVVEEVMIGDGNVSFVEEAGVVKDGRCFLVSVCRFPVRCLPYDLFLSWQDRRDQMASVQKVLNLVFVDRAGS